MFKTLNDSTGGYTGTLNPSMGSVVLPFCAKTSDSTRPMITMPEHTSLESAKTMLSALTGQFAHQ